MESQLYEEKAVVFVWVERKVRKGKVEIHLHQGFNGEEHVSVGLLLVIPGRKVGIDLCGQALVLLTQRIKMPIQNITDTLRGGRLHRHLQHRKDKGKKKEKKGKKGKLLGFFLVACGVCGGFALPWSMTLPAWQ